MRSDDKSLMAESDLRHRLLHRRENPTPQPQKLESRELRKQHREEELEEREPPPPQREERRMRRQPSKEPVEERRQPSKKSVDEIARKSGLKIMVANDLQRHEEYDPTRPEIRRDPKETTPTFSRQRRHEIPTPSPPREEVDDLEDIRRRALASMKQGESV